MAKAGFFEKIWDLSRANAGTKLFSVFLALVLWGIVLGSRSFEATKEIPLEIIAPPELMAANEIPDRISFKLSGPKAFLRVILDRRDEPIRVNLSNSKAGLVTYRFFSDNISLPIGVKVQSITPNSLLIKLEHKKRREVGVQLNLRGEPREGYQLIRAELRPEKVTIVGAESRVDSVHQVETLPLDLNAVRGAEEQSVELDLQRHQVVLDGAPPKVYFQMEPIPANFRIRNVEIRVLTALKARVDEKSVSVHVRADAARLKNLDRYQVYGTVDLRGKARGKYTEPVKVVLPEGIVPVKTIPERVTVTLE